MSNFLTRHRFALQAGFDSACWAVGLWLATFLRYEFHADKVELSSWLVVAGVAVVLQVVVGRLLGLYVHRWRYGTFDEMLGAAKSVLVVTPLVVVANLLLGHHLPVSATVSAALVTLAGMAAGRFAFRVQLDRWNRVHHDGREPVIVFGAGDAGLRIITSMLHSGPFHPVAILDDSRDLRNLRVRGVPVCGDRDDLEATAQRTGATSVVIAIPSASGEVIRKLADLADRAGLRTLVLPSVEELFGSPVDVAQIRPLTEADLLGRREITLDIDSVAGYLTGKRVLVTGAGGSIGSELCRQIQRFAPESLVMLDRDESALQAVQMSIEGRGLLDSRELVVCCIRDTERLTEVFAEHRPEVVFHTAALKHLPLLELHPDEGWKTNVWGTANLLELAGAHGVERFVNISTDKAADPVSVLGRTKRVAERLTSDAGARHEGTYLSVRFGNVLGSRGSVLPLFRAQIDQGGPVTVTDPDVTRYFMTIPEACELVIQAGALGEKGEVLVLDMGEPVRIDDLARRLIQESSRPVEIVYTGLRPGEKCHEVLFGPDEEHRPSSHPLISRVDVPPLALSELVAMQTGWAAPVVDLRPRRRPANAEEALPAGEAG